MVRNLNNLGRNLHNKATAHLHIIPRIQLSGAKLEPDCLFLTHLHNKWPHLHIIPLRFPPLFVHFNHCI